MNILVLHGGISNEREVSLRSGVAVAEALVAAGHTVTLHDQTTNTIAQTTLMNHDVVFPVLHGLYGEDGTLQAQLESFDCRFVGTTSTASSLCFDKHNFRELLQQNSIQIAHGLVVAYEAFQKSALITQPYVLKPVLGGSSLDTFIVQDPTKQPEGIRDAFAKYTTLLLEELISGTEITVGVLGASALPVVEIIPPEGSTFDYENKYNGATQEICPAVSVAPNIQKAAQTLAVNLHKLSGCRDYSRTDMIVKSDGTLIVLETNTSPGMTNQSLFPKAAKAAGLTMSELCDELVNLASRH